MMGPQDPYVAFRDVAVSTLVCRPPASPDQWEVMVASIDLTLKLSLAAGVCLLLAALYGERVAMFLNDVVDAIAASARDWRHG